MRVTPDERAHAEGLLNSVLVGCGVEGVRFWDMLVLLFAHHGDGATAQRPAWDEVWLRIESRWTVFPDPPPTLPAGEDDLPVLPLEQQLALLAGLRGQLMMRVSLGTPHPHLQLAFDSGAVLYVNGRHDRYECWEFGTIPAGASVIAVPGGIAYSLPGSDKP